MPVNFEIKTSLSSWMLALRLVQQHKENLRRAVEILVRMNPVDNCNRVGRVSHVLIMKTV
jgi:hypothetical protein